MAQIRAIRKRMVAVGTIARITKTMQMIATAKFTAALTRAKDSRPYTDAIRNLVGEVSSAAGDYDIVGLGRDEAEGEEARDEQAEEHGELKEVLAVCGWRLAVRR